jgi:hypothetical protein
MVRVRVRVSPKVLLGNLKLCCLSFRSSGTFLGRARHKGRWWGGWRILGHTANISRFDNVFKMVDVVVKPW